MASVLQQPLPRPFNGALPRYRLVNRYFYFFMSLLFAAIVIAGFSRTVNDNLFHPALPRPFLLWIHASAFSGWIVFYMFQSMLVRTHNVRWHRFLGWFGVGLAAIMVPVGVTVAVIMGRFDAVQLHRPDPAFLSIPFYDMAAFAVLACLAIVWRKKPELHRRLLFIASCLLLDAAFARFDFIFNNNLFFVAVDMVILLGVARDLLVDHRVHKAYRYALPILIVGQSVAVYLWHGQPGWWLGITNTILG